MADGMRTEPARERLRQLAADLDLMAERLEHRERR
jgi:hypothetical protein